MSSSLRLLVTLVVGSITVAIVSFGVQYGQQRHGARVKAEQSTRGSVISGQHVIERYACGSCHSIPGISGAHGQVGPALNGIATRSLIAGKLANQPDAMIRWLRTPQAVLPGNGMPNLGLSEQEARDAAAYLYVQR